MLHNLIRNSTEALENSDRKGRIEVRLSKTEVQECEVAEIVVEDNGPGFKTGSVSQVFDPYVTTKPKGTGLGLAIVKKLVEEHAGTIEAENLDDGGAVIRIQLPVNEAAREAMMAMLPGRGDIRREKA
jgi:nitrogen fixation/metabolism regulation signal transduction histidine kinase